MLMRLATAHRETVRTRGATSGGGFLAFQVKSSQSEVSAVKVLERNAIELIWMILMKNDFS